VPQRSLERTTPSNSSPCATWERPPDVAASGTLLRIGRGVGAERAPSSKGVRQSRALAELGLEVDSLGTRRRAYAWPEHERRPAEAQRLECEAAPASDTHYGPFRRGSSLRARKPSERRLGPTSPFPSPRGRNLSLEEGLAPRPDYGRGGRPGADGALQAHACMRRTAGARA